MEEDGELIMPEEPKVPSETTSEVLARLKRQEKTTGRAGAVPRMPKELMLDASEVAAQHPDRHFRWLNKVDKNKMSSRKADGYTILPESEGGRSLGDDMVLAYIPKEQAEQRVAQQNQENDRRLNSHNTEWAQQAEATARMLQDQYGIKVSPEKLTRL